MEVTKAQFAEAMGVSKAMVTKYVRKGLPLTPEGRIDLAAGRAWVEANIDRLPASARGGRAARGAGKLGETLTAARARKESALASLHELELRLRRGELLEAGQVEAAWTKHILAARERLLGLPGKLAPRVLGKTDVIEIQEAIRREIYHSLTALGQYQADA